MQSHAFIAVVALSMLAACGQDDAPIKTEGPDSTTSTISTAQSAPPAPAARDTPPAATPSTHAGTPQIEQAAAPEAQDTKAQGPLKDLTKEEESKSMPKSGQVNNYSTTALDDANKGASNSGETQQSGAADAQAPKEGSASGATSDAPKADAATPSGSGTAASSEPAASSDASKSDANATSTPNAAPAK